MDWCYNLKELTEIRIISARKTTCIEKYINRVISDNIKNLTIKEEWIMLEALKIQREEYVFEVEQLRNTDLEAIKNERFELVKEQIALEVEKELQDKLAAAELNVAHYDFVIANLEAKAEAELDAELNANIEETEIIGG